MQNRKLLATIEVWFEVPSLAQHEIDELEQQAKLMTEHISDHLGDELRLHVWSGLETTVK